MGLKETLADGRFALTAEITPPLSADPEHLLEKARPLIGLADAVNVTDGASARATMDVAAAAALMAREGLDPVLQLTCRDRNRIALQGLLLGAAAQGVRNAMFLRGDDPKKGDQPEAKGVFDVDSTELIAMSARMRDRGELPSGRAIDSPPDLFIGAADLPQDPPDDWVPKGLAAKAGAGAQFAQTQFCMDTGVARRYVARLREHGLTDRIKLIIGVAPLASARSARWIKDNLFGAIIPDAFVDRLDAASDPKAEGRAIAVEVIRELMEIEGVAGAHVMAPLNEAATPLVIEELRK